MPRYRFSRVQFERMVDAGLFGPSDRLELLDGAIIDRAPQQSRHATAVILVGDALRAVFGPGATVRVQLPFCLDDHSEPEPDVAVVPGDPRSYRDAHPSQALLLCEIADSTLAYDRGRKLAAYARAGIPEYWILALETERLEVFRRPDAGIYVEKRVRSGAEAIAPLARPTQTVPVRDLLP
ncbi:Uma2 family endonuclease [Thiococcus pfennigii]|uniref:Uma2 family endonuclease n=1 Tax=Thiococcus pfennigii TaxID=1057 RepID=UPI001A9196CF|nr:Uma2 family endonuclease [Thiococcus pfennigii]